MASFTNFATLSYNGGTTNSNIVTGEILEALTAVKTAVSANYSAGDRITYALSLVNTGTAAVTDYTVTDNLGGYTVDANTVYPLAYNTGTVRYYINGVLQTAPTVTAGPPLTVTGLTIPAGGSAVLIYETTATPVAPLATGSSITNTATITGGGLTNPITAQATVETATSADLTISKSARRRPLRKTARSPTRLSFPTPAIPKRRRRAMLSSPTRFAPILRNIAVTYNGTAWTEGTNYTYNAATGVFTTLAGQITVPAATFTQNTDGTFTVTPGTATLVITGTVDHSPYKRFRPRLRPGLSLPKKALPVPVFPWYNSRNLRLSTNCAHIGRSKRDLWKRKPLSYLRADVGVRHAHIRRRYPRLVYLYALRRHFLQRAKTGNIVLLGIALGTRSWTSALYYVIPISAYALGAFISELIPDDEAPLPYPLGNDPRRGRDRIRRRARSASGIDAGAGLSGVHQLYRLHAIQHVPQLRGRADGHNVRHQPRPSARHRSCQGAAPPPR